MSWGFCYGGRQYLKKKILLKFKTGIVNFHPSYLPFGRGKDPYFWSIVNDEPFGISCHFIDNKIDSGQLIIQKRISKEWTDTGESLREKAINETKSVIKDWVSKVIQSDYELKNITDLSVNYRKDMLKKSFVELDSQFKFREFLNLIRAKSNSDQLGVVFSDSGTRFHVKLQIKECPNGPNSKFNIDCEKEIELQSEDKEFATLSKQWIEKANDLKYSYHFNWMGRPIIQYPTDIIALHEIIYKTKPTFIIETVLPTAAPLYSMPVKWLF